jgi:hypothetical protein
LLVAGWTPGEERARHEQLICIESGNLGRLRELRLLLVLLEGGAAAVHKETRVDISKQLLGMVESCLLDGHSE